MATSKTLLISIFVFFNLTTSISYATESKNKLLFKSGGWHIKEQREKGDDTKTIRAILNGSKKSVLNIVCLHGMEFKVSIGWKPLNTYEGPFLNFREKNYKVIYRATKTKPQKETWKNTSSRIPGLISFYDLTNSQTPEKFVNYLLTNEGKKIYFMVKRHVSIFNTTGASKAISAVKAACEN